MKTFESKTMDVLLKYNNEAAGLPRFSFLDKVDPERVPVRVLKDKGLAVAKEQLGGNDIHSLLNRSTESNFDLMMELDDYDATNNERLANYRQECQDVVDFCIQNGYATHEDIARETSLEIGKQTYASSAQYQFPIVNAALLHSNYSRDMFNIQKDINIWRNKVIARFIAEEIYRNYDLTLKDTNWLILKAKDAGIVKKPDLDIIAVLLSRKVEVTSQYAMAAEKYAIGESIYSRILVFCGLYLYTLQTQTLREDAYNYEQKASRLRSSRHATITHRLAKSCRKNLIRLRRMRTAASLQFQVCSRLRSASSWTCIAQAKSLLPRKPTATLQGSILPSTQMLG